MEIDFVYSDIYISVMANLPEVERFLEKYENLIELERYDELYLRVDDWIAPLLTYVLLNSDIDPLQHISFIHKCMYEYLNIEKIKIPEGVTEIENEAFFGCSKLKTVYLPRSLRSIYEAAFDNCSSLQNVYYNGTQEEFDKIIITDHHNGCLKDLIENNKIIFAM